MPGIRVTSGELVEVKEREEVFKEFWEKHRIVQGAFSLPDPGFAHVQLSGTKYHDEYKAAEGKQGELTAHTV